MPYLGVERDCFASGWIKHGCPTVVGTDLLEPLLRPLQVVNVVQHVDALHAAVNERHDGEDDNPPAPKEPRFQGVVWDLHVFVRVDVLLHVGQGSD